MSLVYDITSDTVWDNGDGMNSGSSVPTASYSPGIDFGAGWASTLQDLAKIGANTWSQNTLMQTNMNGQRYLEGMRLSALQNTLSFNPSTMLMLGGVVALIFMLKD